MIELKLHQKIPIDFIKNNRALILYHSVGTGKTITAIYSIYNFPNEIVVIGPKSSKKTFMDHIKKLDLDAKRFIFYSYAKIKLLLQDNVTLFKNKSVIVDEAHALRTENINNIYITSALSLAFKIILLSATPVINYLNDLSVLVNIVHGSEVLPTEKKLFDQMFFDEDQTRLINEDILYTKLKNTISYYKNIDDQNYPTSTIHYVDVEMNHDQMTEYIYYTRKIIYEGESVVDTTHMLNIDYAKLTGRKKNSFLTITRQISNTVNNSEFAPKIQEIYEKIKKGPYPIVVYSNFLRNGIYTLAILLEKNNITYKTITGSTTSDKLNLIVDNYNNGQYNVLLISSAGSESLDLKNTRQLHIMELHWNYSKIQQVIGRTIRYKSHSDLPINQRHVDIYYWVSIFPSHIKNISADQFLMKISEKKRQIWEKFQSIIIRSAIENNNIRRESISKYISDQPNHHYKYKKYKTKYLQNQLKNK